MTKKRKILSIEFILSQVLKKLEAEEIKTFTGKSMSHFRKCSDPDDNDHTLYLKDAILLDILMQKKELGTPFSDLIDLNLNHDLNQTNNYNNIKNVLINIGGRLGNLMDTTQNAIDPEGQEGDKISEEEKKKIFEAISQLEEKIIKLKLSININHKQ